MDGHSVEVRLGRGVVREELDSQILLGGDVGPPAQRQRRDKQRDAEQQHEQHRQVAGRPAGGD